MKFDVLFNSLVEKACQLPVIGILVKAYIKSREDFNKDMSASIAYFSFLSVFPFILAIIAMGSQLLDLDVVRQYLDSAISKSLPGSAAFVSENIDALTRLRAPVGFVSILVLFWSASKMVAAMTRGINHAMGMKRNYKFILSPLRNLTMTLIVSLLMFVTMSLSPIAEILSDLELDFLDQNLRTSIEVISGHITSFTITLLVLSCIYWLLPYQTPSWSVILPGSVVAALVIELGKAGFLFYISNVAGFEAVYGSLSSIIVLLIWLYLSARFLLYGSEIIAVCRAQQKVELK